MIQMPPKAFRLPNQSLKVFSYSASCLCNGLFDSCINLKTVTFEQGSGPELSFYNEGSWSNGMFVNTKITKLDLPERITSFGNASLNCSTLRTLIIRRDTPP